MIHFYKPKFLMRSKAHGTLRIVDLWTFKSEKSNKRYIVEVEGFEREFYGIKFYWKGVEKSKKRYSMLTNDFEPRTIVRSCVEVMLQYYSRKTLASFGFVAARDLEEDMKGKNIGQKIGSRRFRFYQRMMVNLFGPKTFCQTADANNEIYLMINKKQLDSGAISIKDIENKLNQTYQGEFLVNDIP